LIVFKNEGRIMPDQSRPLGVTIVTLLMAAGLIAGLIPIAAILSQHHPFPYDPSATLYGLSFILIPWIIYATVLFFFWRGREWALWLIMAYAALTLCMAPATIQRQWATLHSFPPLSAAGIALSLFLLVYLNLRSTRAWFQ
jgi:hypothetical protein